MGANPSVKVTVPPRRTFEFYGKLAFINPYGHLSAERWGMLAFYGLMTAVYSVVILWWAFRFIRYRKDLLGLYYVVSLIFGLCLVEFSSMFADAFFENWTGVRMSPLMALVAVLSLVRQVLSRLVVLVVCEGYGIATAYVSNKLTLAICGLVYFIGLCIYQIGMLLFEASGATISQLVYQAPSALFDGILLGWVLYSLNNTMRDLHSKGQHAKHKLYRRIQAVLIVTVAMAAIAFVLQTLFQGSGLSSTVFYLAWIPEATWYLLFTFTLLCFGYICRPSAENRYYAYAQEIPQDLNSSEFGLDTTTSEYDDNFLGEDVEMAEQEEGTADLDEEGSVSADDKAKTTPKQSTSAAPAETKQNNGSSGPSISPGEKLMLADAPIDLGATSPRPQ